MHVKALTILAIGLIISAADAAALASEADPAIPTLDEMASGAAWEHLKGRLEYDT